ncbi:MAG TPA: cupredoxin family copper-binding protein [bacterium]|nr:cupredoxin family copper-binding protein [bacterium]
MLSKVLPAILGLGLLVLPACGGGSATTPRDPQVRPSERTPTTHEVSIVDGAFEPATIKVKVGDTVLWTNNGELPHTVDSDHNHPTEGTLDSDILMPGDTYSFTFTAAGAYPYHCDIHPHMHGRVIVSANGPPA